MIRKRGFSSSEVALGMQQTSLDVWEDKVKPNLRKSQRRIVEVFKRGRFQGEPVDDLTNHEVAQELGISVHRVSPRTGELKKKGVLTISERRRDKVSGNSAGALMLQIPEQPI